MEEEEEEENLLLEDNRKKLRVLTIDGHADISNSFLVMNGSQSIVVDVGSLKMCERILKTMKDQHLNSEDICLIVITHTHYDHVKGLVSLKKKLPKAQILVHENEAMMLMEGFSKIPPGTNFGTKVLSFVGSNFLSLWFNHFPPIKPDIIMKGKEFNLCRKEFGKISGKIIHTPGHSIGSICLIVGDVCCCGDLIETMSDNSNCFPSFGVDVPEIIRSWRILVKEKIRVLLPGHGVRFPITSLEHEYRKYARKYKI